MHAKPAGHDGCDHHPTSPHATPRVTHSPRLIHAHQGETWDKPPTIRRKGRVEHTQCACRMTLGHQTRKASEKVKSRKGKRQEKQPHLTCAVLSSVQLLKPHRSYHNLPPFTKVYQSLLPHHARGAGQPSLPPPPNPERPEWQKNSHGEQQFKRPW